MHPIVSSHTAISFEVDGGIQNPACQDVDALDDKSQQEQPKLRRPARLLDNNYNSSSPAKSTATKDPSSKLHSQKRKALVVIMDVLRCRIAWKFLINIFITISVLLILAFVEFGVIPQRMFGFYCGDQKVSYKFTGDTIPISLLIVGSLAIPIVAIWSTEWACRNNTGSNYKESSNLTASKRRRLWLWYGQYLIGLGALLFICDAIKVVVGEPRPHFLETCRPRQNPNCTGYVQNYVCTNTDDSHWFVSDSSKSFPSGHSAFSTFTAIYVICYLQIRMPDKLSTALAKPWLQCIVLFWCVICSLTRITDHRHHWWDVLAGFVMGIVFAFYTVRVLCNNFRHQKYDDCDVDETSASSLSPKSLENGQLPRPEKCQQSVRKLLSTGDENQTGNNVENREMSDDIPEIKNRSNIVIATTTRK